MIRIMKDNKRDPKRIKRIVDLVEVIWEANSDMRFFQLMDTLQHEYSSQNNGLENEKVLKQTQRGMKIQFRL